ncbi:MAG: Ig domain-containing protein, partial [Gemmatimonadota bacterium]
MARRSAAPIDTRSARAGSTRSIRAAGRGRLALAVLALLLLLPPACSDYVADLPEPDPDEVRGIQLDRQTVELDDGATARLQATLLDAAGQPLAGADASVHWFSEDSATATVADGVVTAQRPGVTSVGAAVETPYGTASVAVPLTVRQLATALEAIAPAEQTGVVGAAATDSPAVRVVDRHGDGVPGIAVRFSAEPGAGTLSDSLVVSDSTGQAAVAWTLGTTAGEQRVTVTAVDHDFTAQTFSAAAAAGPPAQLVVTPDSLQLTALGAEGALTAGVVDAYENVIDGPEISWASSDDAVAAVTAGVVRAVGNGAAWVMAAAGDAVDSARIVVAQEVAELELTPTTHTLASIGATVRLEATARDALGNAMAVAVDWSSSAPGVASVSDAGLVTAVANGAAHIRAAAGGVTDSAAITVEQSAAAVAVSPAELALLAGETGQLNATATDAGGTAIADASFSWSSSAESVATVDAAGLVTAVAEGEAWVRASHGGLVDSARVEVSPVPPAGVEIAGGDEQTDTVASTLPTPLSVLVRDAAGYPLAGVEVKWAVTAGGGSVDPAVSATD